MNRNNSSGNSEAKIPAMINFQSYHLPYLINLIKEILFLGIFDHFWDNFEIIYFLYVSSVEMIKHLPGKKLYKIARERIIMNEIAIQDSKLAVVLI